MPVVGTHSLLASYCFPPQVLESRQSKAANGSGLFDDLFLEVIVFHFGAFVFATRLPGLPARLVGDYRIL